MERICQCGEKLKIQIIQSEEFNKKESWHHNVLVPVNVLYDCLTKSHDIFWNMNADL